MKMIISFTVYWPGQHCYHVDTIGKSLVIGFNTNIGPMMELNWQNDGRLPMMGQYINIIGNKIK